MSNDLLDYVGHAVETGAIPAPIDGESLDSYRLRCAHAGAIVGAQWLTERNAAFAAEQEALVAEQLGDAGVEAEASLTEA